MTAQQSARDMLAILDRVTDLEIQVDHLKLMVNELAGMVFDERDDEVG